MQSKNWLTVLLPYENVVTPETTVPVAPNPTVESTLTTDDPLDTFSIDFVLGIIVKLLEISDRSSNPTKSSNLKYCF